VVHLHKINMIAIMISLVAHLAVLSVPIMLRSQPSSQANEGVVTIELEKSPASAVETPPETKEPVKPSRSEATRSEAAQKPREETVTLGNRKSQYRDYLKKVKGRIDSRWAYPGKAFERGEKGVTTVKFSIDGDGSLTANVVVNTSGYNLLDEGALNVIKAAAPYDPLPREYNLSRLHIIASFHYNLTR
jgi:periplasmic protein TonB